MGRHFRQYIDKDGEIFTPCPVDSFLPGWHRVAESVQNLGHASISTTSQYLHIDADRRHRETEEKHRIEW
jgi:hypothetical protein